MADKCRQLGRLSDEDWERLKRAAEQEHETFTFWAKRVLMKEAKKVEKKNG